MKATKIIYKNNECSGEIIIKHNQGYIKKISAILKKLKKKDKFIISSSIIEVKKED